MWFSLVQESQVLIRSRGGRKRSLSENWLEHKPATTVDNGERRELEMRVWMSGQDKAHYITWSIFASTINIYLIASLINWLCSPLGEILQPQLKKKKTLAAPKARDFRSRQVDKYCLQHQEEDSEGDVETKLYKVGVMDEHQITHLQAGTIHIVYFSFNVLPPSFVHVLSISFLSPSLPLFHLCRVRLCTHVVVVLQCSLLMWKYSDTRSHRHRDHEDRPGNTQKLFQINISTTTTRHLTKLISFPGSLPASRRLQEAGERLGTNLSLNLGPRVFT